MQPQLKEIETSQEMKTLETPTSFTFEQSFQKDLEAEDLNFEIKYNNGTFTVNSNWKEHQVMAPIWGPCWWKGWKKWGKKWWK